MFDSLSTSAIIFVCLCIENAIREYYARKHIQIKFEARTMHDKLFFESIMFHVDEKYNIDDAFSANLRSASESTKDSSEEYAVEQSKASCIID